METKEQLRAFVDELGLVWTSTTSEDDLKKLIMSAAKSLDIKTLSDPLRAFVEDQGDVPADEEDCFGKYHDSQEEDCRRCLVAGNCEILSKGLSTVAFLAGRTKPGALPKSLGGPGKNMNAQPMSKSSVAAKSRAYMDWLVENCKDGELIPRAVYWIYKHGNKNVFTIESVESTAPKHEVLFNRLKDLNSIGGYEPVFKQKFDGWYYIGEDLEELQRFSAAWWRLQK